ncbi:MAG: hypothetical protein AAF989_16165 [Planctomycetota bacterium]
MTAPSQQFLRDHDPNGIEPIRLAGHSFLGRHLSGLHAEPLASKQQTVLHLPRLIERIIIAESLIWRVSD